MSAERLLRGTVKSRSRTLERPGRGKKRQGLMLRILAIVYGEEGPLFDHVIRGR